MDAPGRTSPEISVKSGPLVSSQRAARLSADATLNAGTAPGLGSRTSKNGAWKQGIENRDANTLWRALHRLVSSHPLARAALFSQQSTSNNCSSFSTHDLTQDLYLLLLQKRRFDHYVGAEMSDADIEREIFQIELTNLLISNLRRRRPENYRMIRRLSHLLETDARFRQYRKTSGRYKDQPARYRQAAEAVYGLSDWSDDKPVKDSGTFSELIVNIPVRMRNLRRAGCAGDAQVIVNKQELTELLVEIMETIDSPAPLRVLRQLALARLPVCDPDIASIDDDRDEMGASSSFDFLVASDDSPEHLALKIEHEREAQAAARSLLSRLDGLTRSNAERTERLWRVLWHSYFDADEPSQLEIAERVGVSDSSVSDYRRKIAAEMRKLKFHPDHLRSFTEELDAQLRWRLGLSDSKQELRQRSAFVWNGQEFKKNANYETGLNLLLASAAA
jgi:hypothetical protein